MYTYKYVVLNEKLPIMKQNLRIFFFIIGGVECINSFKQAQHETQISLLSTYIECPRFCQYSSTLTINMLMLYYNHMYTNVQLIPCAKRLHGQ